MPADLGSRPMCTFCDIADGSLAAHAVFEDDRFVAFLDHRPVFPGHTLLIPRVHHETLPDLPAELIEPYFSLVQRLSTAVPHAMAGQGTFVAINNKISQSVPHLHVHIVPRRPKDGLRGFFWPRTKYGGGDEEMAAVAATIRAAIAEAK
jgi:histidine triad (HIT) family protein